MARFTEEQIQERTRIIKEWRDALYPGVYSDERNRAQAKRDLVSALEEAEEEAEEED